jgi:hypothetical protein
MVASRTITPSPGEFAERLTYCPDSGNLLWRPKSGDTWRERAWNTSYAGTVAGSREVMGYLVVGVFGKLWKTHRIAWAIYYGEWPKEELDHINGDRTDNRIANLRAATRQENCQNLVTKQGVIRGHMAVHRHKKWRKWQARICVNYKRINLGMFDTPEEAYQAYLAAKAKLHKYDTSGRECLG